MENLKHRGFLTGAWALPLLLIGCDGSILGAGSGSVGPGGLPAGGGANGPDGTGAGSSDCATTQVGPERVSRLKPREYTNTVRALLANAALEPVLHLDREPIATLDAVRKWYNAADVAVPSTSVWWSAYGSCDPEAAGCAVTLYESFAERAFRRPLEDDERTWLATSWAALPAAASVALRLETIAELVLQAPQFLYLYSEGKADGANTVLDGYERAQRLAYFLWDGPPDQVLLDAARTGQLETPAGMREQGQRLLADERAKPVLRSFLTDWLELDGAVILPGLDQTPKAQALYPEFDEGLRRGMRREIEAFMDDVMFEQDGSLEALFTSTRAYVNGPLAELYGVAGPSGADEWAWVDLNPTERAGMLTRAGFLAVHATQTITSPIRRGVYMLKEVLCVDIPAPPANVDNSPIEVAENDPAAAALTVREATLKRTGNATCAGCHVMINELGFAFEHDACSVQQVEAKTFETRSIRELLLAMVETDSFLRVNHGD